MKVIVRTFIFIVGMAGITLGAVSLAGGAGGIDLSDCIGFGAGVTDNDGCDIVGEGAGQIDVSEGVDAASPDTIFDTVTKIINYALGLLAIITLVLLIYGGFVMLFNANDDAGYKKGFTILKNAAIALAFIGLAWILVRFIFFVIDFITGG